MAPSSQELEPPAIPVRFNDILMVAYRHIGRAFRGADGAFNVALCKITNLDRNQLDDDFLSHLVPSKFVRGELLKASERSLIPSMSIRHLEQLMVPIPPLRVQIDLVQKIREFQELSSRAADNFKSKLAAIAELKQAILQKAFAGELTKDFCASVAAPKASARVDA